MVKLIAINAASLAIIAVLAELIFGFWVWGDPLNGLNIFRNVTWRYSANHLYPREDAVVYRRDKWGFRGTHADPGEIEVLVLGGSTTDERFVSEGETWTNVLERCLAAKGRPLKVANAGVSGQSTKGFVANFDLWFSQIPNIKPKYVIAYTGINDIWALSKEAQFKDDPRRFNEEKDATSSWGVSKQRLKMKSALYRLYRTVKGQWIAWRAGMAYKLPVPGATREIDTTNELRRKSAGDETRLDAPTLMSAMKNRRAQIPGELKNFENQIEAVLGRIGKLGAKPVLVTQAWATYRVLGDRVNGHLGTFVKQEPFHDVARRMCKKANLACVDLAREFVFEAGDTYDVVHTTPQGSRRGGEFLCRKLLGMLN